MKKHLIQLTLTSIAVSIILLISYIQDRPDGLLHVIFCDVGQGDATYIKMPTGEDVLIDGGPSQDVLVCLGNHMAFWDRTIELVILTHPQHDHYGGLIDVADRYTIEKFVVPVVDNEATSYQTLKREIAERNISILNLYAGDIVAFGDTEEKTEIDFLWPDRKWVADNMNSGSREAILLTNNVIGATTTHDELNDFSYITLLHYKLFDVLLTGDAETPITEKLVDNPLLTSNHIELLKMPHHGSRHALNQDILNHIKPNLTVISVGAKNSYHHPNPILLDLLKQNTIPALRTDQAGEIEIISNGEWWKRR